MSCFLLCLYQLFSLLKLEEMESALIGKREQVEELKRAMMTENLEALSLTPPDPRLAQCASAVAVTDPNAGNGLLVMQCNIC